MHDIFSDATFGPTLAELARLSLPQSLKEDADGLREGCLLLSEFGYEIAISELAGLRAEKALTQKFRAPQTLSVLSTAHDLLTRVDVAARPVAHVPPEQLAQLADAMEEVRPIAGRASAAQDDELDDAV